MTKYQIVHFLFMYVFVPVMFRETKRCTLSLKKKFTHIIKPFRINQKLRLAFFLTLSKQSCTYSSMQIVKKTRRAPWQCNKSTFKFNFSPERSSKFGGKSLDSQEGPRPHREGGKAGGEREKVGGREERKNPDTASAILCLLSAPGSYFTRAPAVC